MMHTDIDQMAQHARIFQLILKPVLNDPAVESWQLALALSWAKDRQIKFLWFRETAGLTHNGLTAIDTFGDVVWSDVCGFMDEDERLFHEALAAHELMHEEREVEYLDFE